MVLTKSGKALVVVGRILVVGETMAGAKFTVKGGLATTIFDSEAGDSNSRITVESKGWPMHVVHSYMAQIFW